MEKNRCLYYAWKKREELKDKKTGPKNPWWAITKEKAADVINIFNNFKEIASNYVVAVKAGISATSAGRIINDNNLRAQINVKEAIRTMKSCEWLKRNICYSIDSIVLFSEEGKILLQLLVEEYSRCILGWVAGHLNTADKAVYLLNKTIVETGIKPLVVKFDRGSEFKNAEMERFLKEKDIIAMPSPRNYPRFNGKEERTNRIFKKFFKSKKIYTVDEICEIAEKVIKVINHELPRNIFKGKTSGEIYKNAENYREEDRVLLINKINERIKEIQEMKNPRWDKFDVQRKAVVKSVVDMQLCVINPEGKMANCFEGGMC